MPKNAPVATVTLVDEFVLVQCPGCGCWFGVSAERYEWHVRGMNGSEALCCPNGHGHVKLEPSPDYRWRYGVAREKVVIRAEIATVDPPKIEPIPPIRWAECPTCHQRFTKRGLNIHIAAKHKEKRDADRPRA